MSHTCICDEFLVNVHYMYYVVCSSQSIDPLKETINKYAGSSQQKSFVYGYLAKFAVEAPNQVIAISLISFRSTSIMYYFMKKTLHVTLKIYIFLEKIYPFSLFDKDSATFKILICSVQ
jgi:hypothetical protein